MALTDLPNTAIDDSANTPYNDEVPVDLLTAKRQAASGDRQRDQQHDHHLRNQKHAARE
jgi:hypothetical protein